MAKKLIEELRTYYQKRSIRNYPKDYRHPLTLEFEAFAEARPEASPMELKAMMYRRIAEYFTPHLFAHSPFYFATGLMPADWECVRENPGCFLQDRAMRLPPPAPDSLKRYRKIFATGIGFAELVDRWHFCPGYSNILEAGYAGILEAVRRRRLTAANRVEAEFLDTAEAGLLAMKSCADKFAAEARRLLAEKAPGYRREFLQMIAAAAAHTPWQPPRNFHEGLAALCFIREVQNCFDGIHLDILGHPDRMLLPLYRADLAAGHLTPAEADDLIRRFLVISDCKHDPHERFEEGTAGMLSGENDPARRPLFVVGELNATLTLGGCDDRGEVLYNDLTKSFLRIHREENLIYPKLLCRYRSDSPPEYLQELNRDYQASRSVAALVNDEAIIPAQVAAGKRLEDARRYQVGGCWEVTLEGCEDSSSVTTYFNLGKVVDLSINLPEEFAGELQVLDGAADFEEVYRRIMKNFVRIMDIRCRAIAENGPALLQGNPAPLFSASLAGCVEKATDFSAGGARYNPHGNPCFAFANLADSLLAIDQLCFKDGVPLSRLLTAVRGNWAGEEALRQQALHAPPHWGDNTPASNALAARLYADIAGYGGSYPNERGGPWQCAFYVYRLLIQQSAMTAATPDGRRQGDCLAQGITPSRMHRGDAVTDVLNALGQLDCRLAPGNRVLDLNLPLGGISAENLEALERAAAKLGVGMLQLNCVNLDMLRDAQRHPERYPDLIVRLYGYSARFTLLPRQWQDEFIGRTLYRS